MANDVGRCRPARKLRNELFDQSPMLSSTSKCLVVLGFTAIVALEQSCIDLNAVDQPPYEDKAAVARWIMHRASFGTLATISKHLNGVPFGNVVSFVDGTEHESFGHLYFKVSRGMERSIT